MAKKANYDITMKKDNSKVEVKGEIHGHWGIHKREDGYFALTHLASGTLVCSAQKKKDLVELLEDEEFKNDCWGSDTPANVPTQADVNRLSKTIGQFYTKKC